MGNTGRWLWDKNIKKMVKISEDIPKIASKIDGVFFPADGKPYIENFGGAGKEPGVEVRSKGHKKQIMEERGIEEAEETLKDVPPESFGKTLYSIPKGQTQ